MSQANNPLHGITLEAMLVYLVSFYGWDELGERVPVNCFRNNPSLKSSLKFLRRTPWARQKVEKLYLDTVRSAERPKTGDGRRKTEVGSQKTGVGRRKTEDRRR